MKKVIIGGYRWNILFEKPKVEHAIGLTDVMKLTIWIEPDMAETIQKSTLVHELLHAIAFTAGKSEKDGEEAWVSALAPLLFTMLRDNKELRDYLF